MKLRLSVIVLILMMASALPLWSATVAVTNLNEEGDGIYALFNQSGTMVSGDTVNNVRFGYFSMSDSAILDAWNAGDLAALNAGFVQFGASFGMYDLGIGLNGYFDGGPNADSTAYVGQNLAMWASTGSDFLDTSAEFLIFRADAVFEPELWLGGNIFLGTSDGVLLVGEFGKFSYDYGYGAGLLPGFNTVAVIPEPSTYVLILLGVGGLILLRRKSGRGSRNAA